MHREPVRYTFLSREWIEAVVQIRDEYADRMPAPTVVVRANVVVTDTPFGEDVRGSIDTSRGLALEPVELESPDFTVSLDYATAKALFVEQDPNAVVQAFFGGRIRLTGDASKLLAVPLAQPQDDDPAAQLVAEIAQRVRAITARPVTPEA
ncbi:MAG TPA: hypothetical protein VF183_08780 [Acidimicrobiales bacterium]